MVDIVNQEGKVAAGIASLLETDERLAVYLSIPDHFLVEGWVLLKAGLRFFVILKDPEPDDHAVWLLVRIEEIC